MQYTFKSFYSRAPSKVVVKAFHMCTFNLQPQSGVYFIMTTLDFYNVAYVGNAEV